MEKDKVKVACGLVFRVTRGKYFLILAERSTVVSLMYICEAACSVYLSCIVKGKSLVKRD